jgi:uncharacterized membrane protein
MIFMNYKGKDYSNIFGSDDIQAGKVAALLGYPLFFLPLVIAPNSKFARFHANQGLIIFIFAFINSIVQNIFRFSFNLIRWGWNWNDWRNWWSFNPFSLVFNLIGVALLAAIIYGIVNAANSKAVEIPIIGKFRILT